MKTQPTFHFIDSNGTPWKDSKLANGVRVKNLGKANGRAMQLIEFSPGATFADHRHKGPEFIFLLEGEAVQNGQLLRKGWASVAESGTIDTDFHSEKGCVFIFHYAV